MKTVQAQIDLSALKYNVNLIKDRLPGCKVYSVLKADAYGHGSVRCAQALNDTAYGFAVARIEEAIELREAGIDKPVLMLGGFFREDDLSLIEKYNIEFTVHSLWQIEALDRYQKSDVFTVWLQVNVGMQRLGFNSDELAAAKEALSACTSVKKPIGIISHLSCADDESLKNYNKQQLQEWNRMAADWNGPKCLSNSAACAYFPEKSTEFVRPGITQYGISPTLGKTGRDLGLKPVMKLSSEVIAIRDLKPGDVVGYGASWVCEKPTRLAIVAVGYADGYPRAVPSGTPVEINGRLVKTAGHVCMDMMFIDLGADAVDKIGDKVYLWGTDNIAVETIAESINTIPYELVCHLSDRVEFIYS
ncbi:MAG: alanine racemase [Ruminobacter sp.]|uniref:Alanine racemase n=2 Tax=Ruminobacter amylophilus TaxID=867 RepID=A0A662ZK01_9GAMM|nr:MULTISPECIES: alanine racemase [Ruminobacter]MBQ3775235.1 alanine racemase [Ruminobacter sp.]SFP55153.1 alanine racemase [Ruminobacter amylophilus]